MLSFILIILQGHLQQKDKGARFQHAKCHGMWNFHKSGAQHRPHNAQSWDLQSGSFQTPSASGGFACLDNPPSFGGQGPYSSATNSKNWETFVSRCTPRIMKTRKQQLRDPKSDPKLWKPADYTRGKGTLDWSQESPLLQREPHCVMSHA